MSIKIKNLPVLITVLFLIGCNTQYIDVDEYTPDQNQQIGYYNSIYMKMANSEEGYFFISNVGDTSGYLYYKDKISVKIVPLCNKPDCLHNDDTCNSYIGQVKSLVWYDGNAYYVRDGLSIAGNDTLYQLLPGGSGYKELLCFSEAISYLTIHRGYVYYVTTDYGTIPGKEGTTETTMCLYRLPVNKLNSKPEFIYEVQGINGKIGKLLCYEDYIYFFEAVYTDASLEQSKRQINRYNILNGTIETTLNDCTAWYTVFDGKLAFTQRDGTYLCDLDGKNIFKVWDQWGVLVSNSKYLLIDNVYSADVRDGKVPRSIIAIDTEYNCLGEIKLNGYQREPIGLVDNEYIIPHWDESTKIMSIYKIPVAKIADGTGKPEVFFEYTGELKWN